MSRQRFALLHLSPISLLGLLVLCVPLTWAQRTLEPVSYMPQQQRDASEPDHAQEVLDVIFPAGD